MAFPKQEHWSGLPFPSPGSLRDPGVEPTSPALAGGQEVLAGGLFTTEPPGKLTVNTMLLLLLSRFSRVRLCATP